MNNPHDKFFKSLFSRKDDVINFINGAFPSEIKDNLNLQKFQSDSNSYIDKHLKEHFTDFVYNCAYGEKQIKIALLFEHKSRVSKFPHFQIIRYFINLQEQQFRNKNNPIPLVPVIIYHGNETWKYKKLHEYFQGIDKILLKYIPEFEYLLIDLSEYSIEQIKQIFNSTTLQISLLLLKYIFDIPKLKTNFFRIFEGLSSLLETNEGRNFYISILHYLFHASDLEDKYIVNAFEKISTTGGEIAMTTAEKLIQKGKKEGIKEGINKGIKEGIKEGINKGIKEGIKEGINKGIKEGKIETAIKMIEQGFQNDTIASVTGVADEEIQKLRSK